MKKRTWRLEYRMRAGLALLALCVLAIYALSPALWARIGVETMPEEFILVHNPALVFIAVGLLLLAAVPLTGQGEEKPAPPEAKRAAWLPWATGGLVLAVALPLALLKPYYGNEPFWMCRDEGIHIHYTTAFLITYGTSAITWNLGYIPQTIGMAIGQLLHLSAEGMYRCGTVAQSLVYALMCALAVWRAPRYKATFLALATMPASIFLASTMNYDITVIGALLLAVALLLEQLERGVRLGAARAMLLLSLFSLGTVAKPVYSLLLPLCWLIPADQFASKRSRRLFRLWSILLLLWCLAALLLPVAYDNVRYGDSRYAGTDAHAQLAWMLAHPAEVLRVIGRTVAVYFGELHTVIYEWADLGTSAAMGLVYAGLLLLVCPLCTEGEAEATGLLTARRRLTMLALAFLALLVLTVTQYLLSNPVGWQGFVEGMQTRYALPLGALFAAGLMLPQGIRWRARPASRYLTAALCGYLLFTNGWYALFRLGWL